MINRELTEREKEILGMIRPTTFQDIVDIVRRDIEYSKYDVKRELRNLRNGANTNSINGAGDIIDENRRERINIGRESCEVLT